MLNPFALPLQVAALMAGFDKPWYIAGGWAIDLYLGRVTRPHQDIDIAILRCDQQALYKHLKGWAFKKAIPGSKERAEVWTEGEWLELPIHEIHASKVDASPSEIEILLNESSGDHWKFRRNLRIARPLLLIALRSPQGIPFLAPEIALLYKAKNPTPASEADFKNAWGMMDDERKLWLREALSICHPDHRWLCAVDRK